MGIYWEEAEVEPTMAQKGFRGVGDSGESYGVWYGPAYVNGVPMLSWVAQGWPEYDSDNLPLLESYEEAVELCEQWEAIKVDAEQRARAVFAGTRSGNS